MAGYVIQVGHFSPQKVIIGYPDRVTGQPVGETFETHKQVGVYQIINRCRVWARRVLPDGKLPKQGDSERPLEVNDPLYRGNLEFLTWGENKVGAQAIEIRYLSSSSSLDYDYQRNIQKIETRVEDGTDMLILTPGQNKFDTEKQALLIQMFKVHAQNRDSKSKNPDPQLKGFTYYEITNDNVDKASIARDEAAIDAGVFIKGLSTSESMQKNLLEIFLGYGVDFGEINLLSTETDIYRALLAMAKTSPDEMWKNIDRYKRELLDLFEKAISFEVLDLTKDGFIAMTVKGKPQIIWKDADGKGKKMIDWVLDNFLEPSVYDQTKQFKSFCSTELK